MGKMAGIRTITRKPITLPLGARNAQSQGVIAPHEPKRFPPVLHTTLTLIERFSHIDMIGM